jgi:hypothetical protein
MQSSLRDGPSLALARRVAEELDWSRLTFMTFAGHGLADAELLDFRNGGKVSSEIADNWLMDWLSTSLVMDDAVLIAEDWRASRTSPFLVDKGMPAFFHGDEVYYLLREQDPRDYAHWRQIFSNAVPAFHAFVISGNVGLRVGSDVPADLIQEFAGKVRAVICGAYDGEGYVVGAPAAHVRSKA